jgi:hypothetical protein
VARFAIVKVKVPILAAFLFFRRESYSVKLYRSWPVGIVVPGPRLLSSVFKAISVLSSTRVSSPMVDFSLFHLSVIVSIVELDGEVNELNHSLWSVDSC